MEWNQPLSERYLPDGAQERAVAQQAEFVVKITCRRCRVELLGVNAVIEHAGLAVIDASVYVEASSSFGNGEHAAVAIQIGDVLPTKTDDIPNVRNARHAKIGRHRAGKSAHGKAVGVDQRGDVGFRMISASRSRRTSIGRCLRRQKDRPDRSIEKERLRCPTHKALHPAATPQWERSLEFRTSPARFPAAWRASTARRR